MKKNKIISFTLALILFLSLTIPSFAVVGKSSSFYCADYSNVLSNQTEQAIIDYNGALENQCQGAQIVVVTVDYLDGMYCDDYAYTLFNDWGVGSAKYNNGMLLLLATEEGKAWLANGIGLNLSSSDVDNMLDKYFWSDFDKSDFDKAVNKLLTALLKWYDKQYGSNVSGASAAERQPPVYNSVNNRQYVNNNSSMSTFKIIIRLLVIYLLLSLVLGRNRRNRDRGSGSWLPWLLLLSSRNRNSGFSNRDWPPRGGGFGGSGRSGRSNGGFGRGSGRGGGGFSGGGGGRR